MKIAKEKRLLVISIFCRTKIQRVCCIILWTPYIDYHSYLQKLCLEYRICRRLGEYFYNIRKTGIRICIPCDWKCGSLTMSPNILKDIFLPNRWTSWTYTIISVQERDPKGYIGTILSRLPAHIWNLFPLRWAVNIGVNLTILHTHGTAMYTERNN